MSPSMIWLTQYGREAFWSVVILFLFLLGGWTGKKSAIVMLFSFLVLTPIVRIVKEILARPRPIIPESDFLIAADTQYAFPSGHAVTLSSGAVIALLLFSGSRKELAISLCLTALASLVCFSRVYVGGHYPLDVFGGILLGVAVSLLFRWKIKILEKVIGIISFGKYKV